MAEPKAQMKGLVLAGGKGMRLRPFTYTGAKQLVPIANKPVVHYAIEELVASGITDIALVSGENLDQFKASIGDGERLGAKMTYIHQPLPLGIAHGVKIAGDFLGDDPFVLFLGDNFIREGIAGYVERFRRDCHNCMVLLCSVEDATNFGVAELDGDKLVRVIEKPKEPPTDLAVIGIYMFDKNAIEAVNKITPSARGELEITDTIQWLIDAGLDVRAEKIEGPWIDTGKHDDLLEANQLILEDLEPAMLGRYDARSKLQGRVVIQEGAEVINSRIQGPAIIGDRTRIVDSYVGPFTSIYHDCLITETEISGSVVLENTRIEGVRHRITDSLIGRNVTLQGDSRRPHGYTLILGDFSNMQIVD